MKTHPKFGTLFLLLLCAAFLPAWAGAQSDRPRSSGVETNRDLPGTSHHYYGQRISRIYRDPRRRLAKVDLDADLNYDGLIDNRDPADGGAFEHTPPGLQLGVGEMTRIIMRILPYRLDFRGQAVVSVSVDGVNRAVKSGLFESLDQEIASTGRVRVWRDQTKSQLILDSADPSRRVYEWVMDKDRFPANLPGIVPRSLYVEGITPSGGFLGDIRLLFVIQHRHGTGDKTGNVVDEPMTSKSVVEDLEEEEEEGGGLKRFSAAYDHLLITVRKEPIPKEFVIENIGTWIAPAPGGRGK